MPERSTLKTLDDFALPLSRRTPPDPYFARLCDWSEQIRDELWRCHEMARQWGIILESRIPNPDEGQIVVCGLTERHRLSMPFDIHPVISRGGEPVVADNLFKSPE